MQSGSQGLTEAGSQARGFVAELTNRDQVRRMVDGILEVFEGSTSS